MIQRLDRVLPLTILCASLVAIGGCRSGDRHSDSLQPPPLVGPDFGDGYDDGDVEGYVDPGDPGPLQPVPPLAAPSRRERAPVPLPEPMSRQGGSPERGLSTADNAATYGSHDSYDDGGLVPASSREPATERRGFWPFTRSNRRAVDEPVPQRDPREAERRKNIMPPPAPGITRRMRDDRLFLADAEPADPNPVRLQGLEFDVAPGENGEALASFENDDVPSVAANAAESVAERVEWRLAEGRGEYDVWPLARAAEGQALLTEPEPADTTAVPVSATRTLPEARTLPAEKTVPGAKAAPPAPALVAPEVESQPIPLEPDVPLPLISPGPRRVDLGSAAAAARPGLPPGV